ncbi:MAG: hypothetical protein ACREA0_32840, partial [bacterium]
VRTVAACDHIEELVTGKPHCQQYLMGAQQNGETQETLIIVVCIGCVIGVSLPPTNGKHRVQVVFTENQWTLVESFRGAMGDGDSEIVRNIVLAWLSEKSMISSSVKQRMGL